ncbi:hypothetical protein [Nocardia stercoris]|uniref:PspA domain-containing protein n=1 Tax=Nocardia stercoris TaxID=2483361 RepID=A0A3M2KXB7_9NOCA|nr:hypothetical protein [Nocardia stercoris]RMI29891.1 hypothetical protein EBN03_24165 [Nocardia stercoris]
MSELDELAALLASLPDKELATVVASAVRGRPGLDALQVVATEILRQGDAIDADVVPDAPEPSPMDAPESGRIPVPDTIAPSIGTPVAPGGFAGSAPVFGGYTSGGVPTFDSVREKVERRFGTAQGMEELDRQTPAGRSTEEQWEAREQAARDRLEQIRKSLRDNKTD